MPRADLAQAVQPLAQRAAEAQAVEQRVECVAVAPVSIQVADLG